MKRQGDEEKRRRGDEVMDEEVDAHCRAYLLKMTGRYFGE